MTKYQICNRCVMDTSDSEIVFDSEGICNHCTDFLELRDNHKVHTKEEAEKHIDAITKRIKNVGKNNKYDCIVGISGGVDSCYTAYLCKELGLRTLLVHMDNGWDSEIAVKNIKTIAEKLEFDYMSYVLDWEEFREIQLGFIKSSIVDIEMPTDIAIPASIYKIAKKHNVKFLISGGNLSAEGILPLQWGYHVLKDMKLYKYIVKKYSSKKISKVPVTGLYGDFYHKFIKKIKTIYILNYYPFDKDKAKQFLIDELGWEDYGGKHHESKITAFWQSYVMPTKFNMDYRRATYYSQICSNQITREKALELLKPLPYDISKVQLDKEFIAKKFGITTSEFDGYLNLPPKTYKDFPNNKKMILYVYDLYRKFFSGKNLS